MTTWLINAYITVRSFYLDKIRDKLQYDAAENEFIQHLSGSQQKCNITSFWKVLFIAAIL